MPSYRINCDSSGKSYCLNGGSCLVVPTEEDDEATTSTTTSQQQHEPCLCNPGFTGAHCEITLSIDKSSCTLNCLNGGRCELLDPSLKADQPKLPWPLSSDAAVSADDMHCVCPAGFSGYNCEYEADICGNFEHICLHGSKCSLHRGDNHDSYECTCPRGKKGCQKPHQMEYCTPKAADEYHGGMAVPAFCLNGGKCRDVLSEDGEKWHAGCDCPPFFEGPRCELIKSPADLVRIAAEKMNNGNSQDNGGFSSGAWTGIAAMCAVLALGTVLFTRRMVRVVAASSSSSSRRPSNHDASRHKTSEHEINIHGFRDEILPGDGGDDDEELPNRTDGAFSASPPQRVRKKHSYFSNNGFTVGGGNQDDLSDMCDASALTDVNLS